MLQQSLLLFQFHKGTIKPKGKKLTEGAKHEFQFHKGTIKPIADGVTLHYYANFNSIKVRLNLWRTF